MTDANPDIETAIEDWKEQVLDLTRRNELVDFTATEAKSLPVDGPHPDVVATRLVTDDRLSIRKQCAEHPRSDRNGESALVAARSPEAAADSLSSIEYHHRQYLRERGVDTLFLSLGQLRWTTPADDDPLHSPLF